MQEFNVSLADEPGELAKVASAVGDEGINILGCVGMGRSTASLLWLLMTKKQLLKF